MWAVDLHAWCESKGVAAQCGIMLAILLAKAVGGAAGLTSQSLYRSQREKSGLLDEAGKTAGGRGGASPANSRRPSLGDRRSAGLFLGERGPVSLQLLPPPTPPTPPPPA